MRYVASTFRAQSNVALRIELETGANDAGENQGYCLRRTAFRILSSSSTSIISKPRSIATFPPSVLRISRQSPLIRTQTRFASDDATTAEPEAEGETPAETSSHSITASSDPNPSTTTDINAPSSADPEDRSTIAAALDSVKDTATTQAAATAESFVRSAESAKQAVADTAAAAGLGFAPKGQEESGTNFQGGRGTGGRSSVPSTTVYVGNLYFDVTEEDLRREMERFGTVMSIRIIYDGRGLSKGFGYIDFANVDQAAQAIEGMNQQVFEGRRLTVQYSMKKDPQERTGSSRHSPSKTLFIGNMSFEMSDKDLNELFRDVHNVIDVRVAIDRKTGQPRGFAHADFIDVRSAEKAFEQLKGKEVYGRRLRVDYSVPSTSTQARRMPDRAPTTGARGMGP